ncbi:hypothetical protein LEN26_001914 [Aphanomyces euteiches]|nr:hypothetical protein LEN26_001914 [Aphanomyces euteiches]
MFDGTIGRRPRVSMSGKRPSSNDLSKKDFLASAREERAQRAQTRLFHVTSQKLQAWYRGCRARRDSRREFQQAVKAKCSDILALQRILPTFVVPVPVLTRLVQEIIYSDSNWTKEDPSVPIAVVQFVEQSQHLLQTDWVEFPEHKKEWAYRLASLSVLTTRLSPIHLKLLLPFMAQNLPNALLLWAKRSTSNIFDALIVSWQTDVALYQVLSPLVWSLVETFSLHTAFAQTLLSVPLSARESQLKSWLDLVWSHIPPNTSWISTEWQHAIVLGNILELLASNASSEHHVHLVVMYTTERMLQFAFTDASTIAESVDPIVCGSVQAQLHLFASHPIILKLFTPSQQLHQVAERYAWLCLLLLPFSDSNAFMSTIFFSISNGGVILSLLFDLLPRQSSRFSPTWLLFSASYSHYLRTADDQSLQSHFPHLEALVSLLNQSLYTLCWLDTPSYSPAFEAQLKQMISLYNQLYWRHSRVAFCPKNAWLWPSIAIQPDIMQQLDPDDPLGIKVFFELNSRVKLQCILTTFPQVIPFDSRVTLFHSFLRADKQNVPSRHVFGSLIPMRIQRDRIVQDSFIGFQFNAAALKGRMQITFINEQGLDEAGVDGGGMFKEYMDTLTKTAFSTEFPCFLATEEGLLYPNPQAHLISDVAQEHFRFLGRVLAKALYEEILIEPQFALFFLQKMLGQSNTLDDLQSLDAQLYRNIIGLKQHPDVASFGLTFSIASEPNIVQDLVSGGQSIAVTNENVIRYCHLFAHYKLNVQIAAATRAFLEGFHDLIPTEWLHLFSPTELQMLIGGSTYDVNIADWKANTNYAGGYHPSQPIIHWFWEIVEEMTSEQRGDLLRFITSCSRQPLLGFKQLNPLICIQQVRIHDDDRLPSSATCMNILKLPTYTSKEIMRGKLLYAIQAKAGFELS